MHKRARLFSLIIVLIMVIGLIGPVGFVSGQRLAKAHPLLLQLAAESPEQLVVVIVQKMAKDTHLQALVAQLGGVVTKDLSIINAFAAELEAADALALAGDPDVRWVSLDAPVEQSGKPNKNPCPDGCPPNFYLDTLNVRDVWNMGFQGEGVAVAIIDSGVTMDRDFATTIGASKSRVVWQESFSANSFKTEDATGHGTHVAGIAGGNGTASGGFYSGVAPKVNLINLKVSDEEGMAYESDVVAAIQWVYDNRDAYNIRVANLSLNSTVEQSYHLSPLNAAVEILWFNGVVVVASAGNKGPAGGFNTISAAPANDPFIITVGAVDEHGTSDRDGDSLAPYSSLGMTRDGFTKPDIVAPGTGIISILSDSSSWRWDYPDRTVINEYFRLSGTSMAAPMVTGAVALLLQDEPNLTPDQVKYRLLNTAPDALDAIPYLDVYAAVTGTTTESANTGLTASQLLWSGSDPVTWGSVAWNSVAWNSVAWNSVAWNSVAWNSVAWNSVAWNE